MWPPAGDLEGSPGEGVVCSRAAMAGGWVYFSQSHHVGELLHCNMFPWCAIFLVIFLPCSFTLRTLVREHLDVFSSPDCPSWSLFFFFPAILEARCIKAKIFGSTQLASSIFFFLFPNVRFDAQSQSCICTLLVSTFSVEIVGLSPALTRRKGQSPLVSWKRPATISTCPIFGGPEEQVTFAAAISALVTG